MGFFKKEQSIEEMEEEHQLLREKRSMLEERVAIKALEEKMGKGGWKRFSSNGKLNGFSLKSAMAWLKAH